VSADRGMSVVVGQAGRRRVTVSGFDGTSDHPQTSQRTVSFCPSGTITKITINNDRERSDTATTPVRHCNLSAPEMSSSATTSPENVETAAPLSSTEADTSASNSRSQYSHLIRRRKKTPQSGAQNEQSIARTAADLPPPALPKPGDSSLTLLQYQKTLVIDIAKQLSAELSAITSFLRVTKPSHIDDRERVAMQSMQRINAAFQRLTSACIAYRRFYGSTCSDVSHMTLPDVDGLRTHDSTLRQCRDKLTASFTERRDVILQTPIAGEQRLFTFVWLQRHSAAIVDSINVVVDVLDAVLKQPTTSSVQTPPDDIKPNVSELNAEAGSRLDDLIDEARPPSLTPAIKTAIVTADEPPVLQPCIYPRFRETPDNARSSVSPSITAADQRRHSQNAQHCSKVSEARQLDSSTLDVPVVSLALKQEQQENISTLQSCTASTKTIQADICERLDQSQLADERARNDLITHTPGQIQIRV